jgi:signal transduction histidine kinase
VLSAAAAVAARLLLDTVLSYHHPYATLYLAVLWSAWYGGLGPALVTTALGALGAIYFFLPPLHLAAVDKTELLGLEFYFIVSISAAIFSHMLHKARQRATWNARMAQERLTELQREAHERARAEQRLRDTQKLESIGILAGGIAHDFNNLLTGIIGNTSLALATSRPDNPIRRYLDAVLSDADRSAKLIQQLLAYAGKGEFVLSNVQVSQVVNKAADLVRPSIPANIQFSLASDPDLPAVRGGPHQIQQVVMNLITNAVEAVAEAPGVVSVTTKAVEIKDPDVAEPQIGELSPGHYVCIEVTDTGSGIRPDVADHIFDPFFTTKFLGRGLGLAAVSGIVRAHKGALQFRSAPGQGATFTVYLPVFQDRPGPRHEPPHATLRPIGPIA